MTNAVVPKLPPTKNTIAFKLSAEANTSGSTMVLIAAEMLAQNPGLGKFVWDEFQNGSSNSLGRIMVAVLTIGFIGFMLDKLMLTVQRKVSWDKQAILR